MKAWWTRGEHEAPSEYACTYLGLATGIQLVSSAGRSEGYSFLNGMLHVLTWPSSLGCSLPFERQVYDCR
jgi:hypothetical protein